MIAMVHWPCPDNAFFSLSPAEPPSAHGCRSHGERYRMALMRSTAPSRSRMAALWAMMNSMQPGVSVMTWRLRPAIFLPAVTPIVEMVPHRGEWRQTLWRHAPLTTAGSDLQDPIHHITQPGRAGPTAGPCRRQERPNQRPFFIRQIAWTAGRAAPVFNASDIDPWHGHSPSSSTRTVNHNPLISLNSLFKQTLGNPPRIMPGEESIRSKMARTFSGSGVSWVYVYDFQSNPWRLKIRKCRMQVRPATLPASVRQRGLAECPSPDRLYRPSRPACRTRLPRQPPAGTARRTSYGQIGSAARSCPCR